MPELPEIMSRAREMQRALVGKAIADIEVRQPKCLNVPVDAFRAGLIGARLLDVRCRGKWLFVETTQDWLLLNLGMGGELLLVTRATMPDKWRLAFDFDDRTCLAVNFWWFGYAHTVAPGELERHAMTAGLGPNALEVGAEALRAMMRGRRGGVKAWLLDQRRIAGIGNAYIHDILFLARLHPLRSVETLSEAEVEGLARAIQAGLRPSAEKGGAFYELNLYGEKGGFVAEDILIGYREGSPCPACGTTIGKIKTGGTSSFICPSCQKESAD